MSREPDLSLPERIPSDQLTWGGDTYALYTLCEMNDESLEAYRKVTLYDDAFDDDDECKVVVPPPKACFPNESLRGVIDHHMEWVRGQKGGQRDHDGIAFGVCVYPDSATGLLVRLSENDGTNEGTGFCYPASMWVNVSDMAICLVNMGIMGRNLHELGDLRRSGPEFNGFNALEALEAKKMKREQDKLIPRLGFHLRLYVVDGIDMDQLNYDIEPMIDYEKHKFWLRICKHERLPASDDPIRRAASMHPAECAENPTFQKYYFIVADKTNYKENGVLVVHLDWDGEVADRTPEQLSEIGQRAPLKAQRAPAIRKVNVNAVTRIQAIVGGWQDWDPDSRRGRTGEELYSFECEQLCSMYTLNQRH